MSMRAAVTTVPKQPTEVRQASLIVAALALAAERSPADVTTAQLAHAIGVTQGAVFRHFASKEAIWLAVFDDVSERMLSRLDRAAEPHTNGLQALEAVFAAHVAFVIEHPGLPRLVFQELQQPNDTPLKGQVRQLMNAYRQRLLGWLLRAQEQGELAPDTNLNAAAVLFIGSIQGLMMQAMASGDVTTMRDQAPSVFQLLRAGMSA